MVRMRKTESMKAVTIAVPEDVSKLVPEERMKFFEKEVDDFSAWMAQLKDWKYQGPLTKPERVLLLTYLMQKYEGKIDEEVR